MIFSFVHDAGSDIVPTAVAVVDVELVVIVVLPSSFQEDPGVSGFTVLLAPYLIVTSISNSPPIRLHFPELYRLTARCTGCR